MSFFSWSKFMHFHLPRLLSILFFLRNMATTYTVVVDSDNMVVPSKVSSYLKILSVSKASVLGKLTNNFITVE